MDSPQPLDARWSMERVERCYHQIWLTARDVAACGVPCVLDLGFTRGESRARFAALAREAGLTAQLHVIDLPAAERWRRVEHRNAYSGATDQLGFAVDRAMFDFVETLWEPPSDAEVEALNGIRVAAA